MLVNIFLVTDVSTEIWNIWFEKTMKCILFCVVFSEYFVEQKNEIYISCVVLSCLDN